MMKKIKLTVSLVVYKPDIVVLSKTLNCLHAGINPELFIVTLYIIDNSCDVGWREKIQACLASAFPMIDNITSEFIVSSDNVGYGQANNLAIEKIDSDYHLILNPDVFIYQDTLPQAIAYLEQHPEVGLLTPAVFGEDAQQHYLCKRNPTLFIMFLRSFAPLFIKNLFKNYLLKFEMRDCDYSKIIKNYPFPTGCFMLFRTQILQEIKGFDSDYFMYMEDADIGRRALQVSETVYLPIVKIIHKWERGSHKNAKLRWIAIKSAFIYWRKWGGLF